MLISSLSVIGVEHATTRWPHFIGSPSRCVGHHVAIDTAFPRRIVRDVTYEVDAAEPTRMSKDQADSLVVYICAAQHRPQLEGSSRCEHTATARRLAASSPQGWKNAHIRIRIHIHIHTQQEAPTDDIFSGAHAARCTLHLLLQRLHSRAPRPGGLRRRRRLAPSRYHARTSWVFFG
jgi:hypothetical protein